MYMLYKKQASYPFISSRLGAFLPWTLGDRHSGDVEPVECGHHQRPLHGVHRHLLSLQRLQEREKSCCHAYRHQQVCKTDWPAIARVQSSRRCAWAVVGGENFTCMCINCPYQSPCNKSKGEKQEAHYTKPIKKEFLSIWLPSSSFVLLTCY